MTKFSDMTNPIPPIEPGPLEMDQPTRSWPKTIGIISLIYALCGMLCGIGLSVSSIAMEAIMKLGGMDVSTPSIFKLNGMVTGVMIFGLGILMLTGAIKVLRRNRSGPKLLRIWSVLRVALILISVIATVLTAPAQIQFQRSVNEAKEQKLRESG